MLLATAAAQAAKQVITFENLPAGTLVTDQYRHAPLAANQGVLFGFNLSGEDATYSPLVEEVGGSLARSGTKVARGCLDKPSCGLPGAGARFLVEQTQPVTVYVAGSETGGGQAALFGASLAGKIVDEAFATIPSGSSAPVPLTVTPPSNEPIVSVVFGLLCCANPAGRIVFDDLTYTTPDLLTPPPPPRFALRLSGSSELSLLRPAAATTSLRVDRVNGSRGAMNYQVDGLPSGVTAAFSPAAPTDASGVSVTLAATADAPAGDYALKVRATPVDPTASGSGAPDRVDLTLRIRRRPDPRIRAIELTQGIQTDDDAVVLPRTFEASMDYAGVPLVSRMKTIARVYADAVAASPGTYVGASVGLFGFRNGEQLPGSPLFPQFGADRLPAASPLNISGAQRRSAGRPPAGPYSFTLPDSWTEGSGVTLEARVVPPQGIIFGKPDALCDSAACRSNDTFTLKKIAFVQRQERTIIPLALYTCQPDRPCGFDGAQGFPPKPNAVFAQAVAAFPTPLRVTSYSAGFEITDIRPDEIAKVVRNLLERSRDVLGEPKEVTDELVAKEARKATMAELDGRLKAYIARNPFLTSAFSIVGVQTGVDAGFAPKQAPRRAVVDHKRPLTSVAHELGHNLGAPHASSACGAEGAQAGEKWPPDEEGRLQGVGLDRRPGSGGPSGEYRIITQRAKPEILVYDFMSYCASDDRSWISPRNWRRFAGPAPKPPDPNKEPPEPPIRKQPIQVAAYASAASIAITDVSRAPSSDDPPAAASAFQLVAKDASGRIVSHVPMSADAPYVHGSELTLLHGEIPAATVERSQRSGGIASLAVTSGATESLPLRRSPQPPKVRLLTPRADAVAGRRQTTLVRWRASDADGGSLTASLDYSADGGRRWRAVFAGPNRNRVTLQSRLLSRSRRARLRLRVSDGFNETVVTSKRFRALGGQPTVTITSPARGNRLRQDAAAYLRGHAFDDALRPLRGRQLTWFVGPKRIGHGERLSVTGLPTGRRRIRLTGRDASRRRTTASVAVRITAVKPLFLVLKAPQRLARTTRNVRLRVAANVPATLLVRGQRYRVTRRVRALNVNVPTGRRTLTLRLQLRSGHRSNRATLRVARR